MIRTILRLLLLAPALALASAAAGAPAEAPTPAKAVPPPVWHAQAVNEGPAGLTLTYYWSKGRSLRSFSVVAGRPILTLVHQDWYYVVDEVAGKGIAVQRSTRALEEDAKGGRPFGQEAEIMMDLGAEKVRTERLGPTQVDVYRLSDHKGRREVWVPADGQRLPLRVEVFDRAMKSNHRVQYISWTQDLELPDRFFQPDPRIELDRMTYDEYLKRAATELLLPILYGSLLHGPRPEDGS